MCEAIYTVCYCVLWYKQHTYIYVCDTNIYMYMYIHVQSTDLMNS